MIPYLDKFSIIGTTDVEYKGDPREVKISDDEVDYLIDVVNQHFVTQLGRDDVVWTYSGVRPLCDDESDSPQAITRDYTLELDANGQQAPLLSIFGGKLTTYRKLAEAAMDKLQPYLNNMGTQWTASHALPGGNFSCSREQLAKTIHASHPTIPEALLLRYVTQFGTYTWQLLEGVTDRSDLGICFSEQAHGVYQREIDYMIEREFAHSLEDILWRRTKLGLYVDDEQTNAIERYVLDQAKQKIVHLPQVS